MMDRTNDEERTSPRLVKGLFAKPSLSLPFDAIPLMPGIHNLPHLLTDLVGREAECERLRQWLAVERLVTVTGPGGVGKTHLAVCVARQLLESFPQGAHLVALAPLADPEALVTAIAGALQFSFYSPLDPKQQLLDYLSNKKLLLLMDNFEHLLSGAGVVVDILQSAPQVKVLATSRERLGLHGETVFELQGLPCPPEQENPLEIEKYGAVQLFLQSARRGQADFALANEADRQALGRICRLVGGLPLAVDVAAAWTRMLPLGEIAAEIEGGLNFLASPWRDTPERHRSLRAVLEYSWKMLSPLEQDVFARLAVFRGNFTRRAAEQVSGAALGVLSALVDKSFLHWDNASGRYHLHPLVGLYAAEKLAVQPEREAWLQKRHGSYFLEFLSGQRQALQGSGQKAALQEIAVEWENIRCAWAWAIRQGEGELLEKGAAVLGKFSRMHGPLQAGLEMVADAVQALQALRGTSDKLEGRWARLALFQAELLAMLSASKSRALAAECLVVFQRLGMRQEIALCLALLAGMESQRGEYGLARQYREESLLLARQEHSVDLETDNLGGLGALCLMQGQWDAARTCLDQALSLARQQGNILREAIQLSNLSHVALLQKEYDTARNYGDRAIHLVQEAGDRFWEAGLLYGMGDSQYMQGNYQLSDIYYQRASQIFSDLGNRKWEIILLLRLGKNARSRGDFDIAQRYYDQATDIQTRCSDQQSEAFLLDDLGVFHRLLGNYCQAQDLEKQALQIARAAGERYVEALALLHLGQVFLERGNPQIALQHGREAHLLAENMGEASLQADIWRLVGDAQVALQDFSGAADAYQKALDFAQQAEGVAPLIASLAGLASVSLAQGSLPQASGQVERILDVLSDGGLTGFEEPIKVYLACYQVLASVRDGRAAELLQEGHQLLQVRTAKIPDERLRRLFLENVPAHRAFLAAYAQLGQQAFLPVLPDGELVEALSEREQEVLRLMAEGLSNQEICEALYVSLNTVKTHSRHIFRKLGVSSRTQAIRYAREAGMV